MFDDEHDEHQKRPDDDSENDAGQDGQSNACSTHGRHDDSENDAGQDGQSNACIAHTIVTMTPRMMPARTARATPVAHTIVTCLLVICELLSF